MASEGQITFDMFIMLADMFRAFNQIAAEQTVGENQLKRGLSEQDIPNRFSDAAIREI